MGVPAPGSAAAKGGLDFEGAKFGVINSLRTGNPLWDMVIAMLVPLMFKFLLDGSQIIVPYFKKLLARLYKLPESKFSRTIKIEQIRNHNGHLVSLGDDNRNTVLMKALTLYLANQSIKFRSAEVSLLAVASRRYNVDSDDENEDGDSRSEVGQLRKNYRLARCVPEKTWVEVDEDVEYFKETLENDNGDGGSEGNSARLSKSKILVHLRALTEEKVDAFLDKAYLWHLSELRKMQDNSRYMYELVQGRGKPTKNDDDEAIVARTYRRFRLSSQKTFASIFFPEKEALLLMVDHFQKRTGKYAIPGYPHKLGLMLYGPPGTGKTSLIKALAHHTQRSIVNVPLARINTNAELTEVMFDNRYQVLGQEVPIKLRFKDKIFVMEDIDAIASIVHRRYCQEARTSAAAEMQEVSSDTPDGSSVPATAGSAKATAAEQGVSTLLQVMQAAVAPSKPTSSLERSFWVEGADLLNLSGILNALDGVVDSPGRILVMTTNHPEKLDSALIRPGRIDKKFLLTYLIGEQAVKMVAHYYQAAVEDQEAQLVRSIVDGSEGGMALEMTPARLEQLCAEHETLAKLIEAMEDLVLQALSVRLPLRRLMTKSNSVPVEDMLAPGEVMLGPKKW
mmetsp:Transcript_70675/g.113919  ORF Transcript_70675/g.113919 Transcript_70675/m.113919 type:complete len:621 (-) Transcript_70675:219-2081(-)